MIKYKNRFTKRLLKYIPGGSHTYSRGADQYPDNAPAILDRGKGAYVFDDSNKRYLDYGMGLRSVNIGYAIKEINDAAIIGIKKGNNLTRPSLIELKAAETFISLIKDADMVKFTKNGSTAVTAAIKLARAYTGKKIVLRCMQHPFFSYDDWFIGSTNVSRGVPDEIKNLTRTFDYNNIESLKKEISRNKNKIACVVLEPAATECPAINNLGGCCMKSKCERNFKNSDHFLKQVERVCKENKIVFVLDEMITGFRWDIKGAQNFYNVKPDLSTFGKAMANGFSVAAVCGKKEIMELGSITNNKQERVFLLSTTHGAEMNGLAAFIETIAFLKKNKVLQKNWKYGEKLILESNNIIDKKNLKEIIKFKGIACSPYYECHDDNKIPSLKIKTLFMQEMIKNKVLMPWVSISFSHKQREFDKTMEALDKSLYIVNKALKNGVNRYLKGRVIKPVFRQFN
jgi:glutamate-1-semialdehyde 2,1-aminomutase